WLFVSSEVTTTKSRTVPWSLTAKSGTAILPMGQLVCAPLTGFIIQRPTSAVVKSAPRQEGGVSVDAAEPHLTPVPKGGGRSLVRSTICIVPFELVPYAKYTRLAVAPAKSMQPPAGPVEIGP